MMGPTPVHIPAPMKSKSKRERASWQQRIVLEKVFQTNQYPDMPLRSQLAAQLGMSPRKVQIWFQNRRTKAKHKTTKSPQDSNGHLGENSTNDINLQNKGGNTLLLLAASQGHSSVDYLLSKGAKANISNNTGQTPLYAAVRNGQEATVALLLQPEYGCNVNIREFDHGESALHVAALKGYSQIASLLIEKGEDINVNIRDHDNYTPLHHACIYGHVNIVRTLLNKKADVNAQSNEGYTPLHAAALHGNPDVITTLLDHGANVNFADSFGYTALTFAVREEKLEAVRVLVKQGASLSALTTDGFDPLLIAACRNNLDIIKLLIDMGCSIHTTNQLSQSALHLSAMQGRLDIVKYFVFKGVHSFADKNNNTPLQYAQLYHRNDIEAFLKTLEPKP